MDSNAELHYFLFYEKNTEQKERIDKKWEENIMMSLVNCQ